MCDRSGSSRASTGRRSRIVVSPIVVNYDLLVVSYTNVGDLPRHTFTPTINNTGQSLTADQSKAVQHAIFQHMDNSSPQVFNERKTIRMEINNGADIFITEVLINTRASTITINNVGSPASSLPDSSQVSTITTRMRRFGITFSNWPSSNPDYLASVLMGLDRLTDDELNRVRNLSVTYRSSPRASHSGRSEAGEYISDEHKIEIYRTAFPASGAPGGSSSGVIMGVGADRTALLPSAALVVLHEIGHAISWGDYTLKRNTLENRLSTMRSSWPSHFHETPSGWNTDSPGLLEPSERPQYNQDVRALTSAQDAVNSWSISDALSGYRRTLPRRGETNIPFTPYLRDLVNGSLSGIEPMQEFFAEGFAIYYYDRQWLQNCASPVYDFFHGGSHLLISD